MASDEWYMKAARVTVCRELPDSPVTHRLPMKTPERLTEGREPHCGVSHYYLKRSPSTFPQQGVQREGEELMR
ncbi:hypothetical protein NQZ68_003026 [Dissostichus eleginoides]|nr:hypothetical protein NQZ68_003026 [Dissostichus eleginoides]